MIKIQILTSKILSIKSNKNQTKVIRGRETTCVGELKNTTSKHINPNRVIKKHNDFSIQSGVARNNKKLRERERENNHFFMRACER